LAILDKNFVCNAILRVAEMRPDHFDRAPADSKVSTNICLPRIHNRALGMMAEDGRNRGDPKWDEMLAEGVR
jgi:hypothetical protein